MVHRGYIRRFCILSCIPWPAAGPEGFAWPCLVPWIKPSHFSASIYYRNYERHDPTVIYLNNSTAASERLHQRHLNFQHSFVRVYTYIKCLQSLQLKIWNSWTRNCIIFNIADNVEVQRSVQWPWNHFEFKNMENRNARSKARETKLFHNLVDDNKWYIYIYDNDNWKNIAENISISINFFFFFFLYFSCPWNLNLSTLIFLFFFLTSFECFKVWNAQWRIIGCNYFRNDLEKRYKVPFHSLGILLSVSPLTASRAIDTVSDTR